jgi:redox-sensitive bicupin YhaK (pirin superfamily)
LSLKCALALPSCVERERVVIEYRPRESLGTVTRDWLQARLHFAFAGMGNPEHKPLGPLRVWNDDEFASGGGFAMHSHADMEIITYVRHGAITHEDSLGNVGRTEAGDVQVMSAGSGIRHSEHNREGEPTLLFQIWIAPNVTGGEPRWSSKRFARAGRSGRLVVLASGYPQDQDALPIRADARILGATIMVGESIAYPLGKTRCGYLVPSTGRVDVNGVRLAPRDGALIRHEAALTLTALEDTELVLVDVA